MVYFYIPACPHPTQISDINSNTFSIFPNPADEYIEIESINDIKDIKPIKILDATGKTIDVIELDLESSNKRIRQDISHLKEGIYYISIINSDSKTELHRFIKLQLP